MRISFFILLFLFVSLNNCSRNGGNEKKDSVEKKGAGVLRVHPSNSRYFTNDTNKAIYLAGAHTWYNIHINPERYIYQNSHETFEDFLDWLQSYGHNFTRLWTNTSYLNTGPYPWERTGPGYASDGLLKFDLTKLNQDYFDILRERVLQIQDRGMYCSIMLFGSFNRMRTEETWNTVAWHPQNNINPEFKIFDNTNGQTFFTNNQQALKIQKLLVAKTLDTVSDIDNLLIEVMNEPKLERDGQAWHTEIVNFAKSYESEKKCRHLIGVTPGWKFKDTSAQEYITYGPGDWWSPSQIVFEGYDYRDGGPASYSDKPVLFDSDHFNGGLYVPQWDYSGRTPGVEEGIRRVWKIFTRGKHNLLMDAYDTYWVTNNPIHPDTTRTVDPALDPVRKAVGQTLVFANKFSDLSKMIPSETIAGSGYCLYNPGEEYLVYDQDEGSVIVDLSDVTGKVNYEWLRTSDGKYFPGGTENGGSSITFKTPFTNSGSVLYINK
ncbi:DUF6298 domain-containing protein [Bacteroidota bacterium]